MLQVRHLEFSTEVSKKQKIFSTIFSPFSCTWTLFAKDILVQIKRTLDENGNACRSVSAFEIEWEEEGERERVECVCACVRACD
jgi:hypothetical protein